MLDDPLEIPSPSGAVRRRWDSPAGDVPARRARLVGRHGDDRRSRVGLEQRDAAHDRAGALRSRVRTNSPPRIADRLTRRAAGARRRSSAASALRTGCGCHRHHRPSVHPNLGRTCGDRGQSRAGARSAASLRPNAPIRSRCRIATQPGRIGGQKVARAIEDHRWDRDLGRQPERGQAGDQSRSRGTDATRWALLRCSITGRGQPVRCRALRQIDVMSSSNATAARRR